MSNAEGTPTMRATQVRSLIRDAAHSGVSLWVEGGQLRYRASKGDMPETLRAALKSNRNDVIGALSTPIFRKKSHTPELVQYPAFWKDFWEETRANTALANAIHLAMKLSGDISLERIDGALERLTSRYDLLRSRIELRDGIPCLRFVPHQKVPFDIVDLSQSAAPDGPLRLKALIEQAIYAPFEDGLLHRARVIKISAKEYVLTFVMHHFVADPMSSTIVADELIASLYDEPGSQPLTDQRPLQYSDYLLGMIEWLPGEGLKYRLAYWQEKMRGAPSVHFPPPRDPFPTEAEVVSVSIDVNERLRARLTRAAAAFQTPFALVLLTATFAALADTLQTTDLVAIMIHNWRDDPALQELVGFTLNCFPVRLSVRPEMSYADLLASVKDNYVAARDYQVPWALLVRSLEEIGASSVAPIFNYLPLPRAVPGTQNPSHRAVPLQVEHLDVASPPQTGSVDWKSHELHVLDNGKDMLITVNYMPSRCSTAAATRFVETFRLCLEGIATSPTQLVRDSTHAPA